VVRHSAAAADNESSSDEEESVAVVRKTRVSAKWIQVQEWRPAEFSHKLLEAQKAACAEDGYDWTNGQAYSNRTGDNDEVSYFKCKCSNCRCVLRMIKQCGAQPKYVLQRKFTHEHDMNNMATKKVPQKVKQLLEKWLTLPGQLNKHVIFRDLSSQGIDTVKEFRMIDRGAQVMGFLRRERDKLRETIKATTWGEFLQLASNFVVEDQAMSQKGDHDVFVLSGFVVNQKSDEIAITFSTKHLLRNLDRWDLVTLCQDGTFKIVCNGNII